MTPVRDIAVQQTWTRATLTPRDWMVSVPDDCVAEMDAVLAALRGAAPPLDALSPDDFDVAACRRLMGRVHEKLYRGEGLVVLDRLPVERYTEAENRAVGWLLASMLGAVVAQKWDGTRTYDVKDSGQALGYGVRRSVTNLDQPFHTDGGWLSSPPSLVGLFCLDTASEGGLSRFVSLVTAHERLRSRPDLLERLYHPFWWDRQAEHAPGDSRVSSHPVFADDGGGLLARYYEDYVVNGQALAGEPLDADGKAALAALRELVDDPRHWVEFRIERGQFQYLNNRRFAHSRTGFADGGDDARRRHMLRFWNREGGKTDLEGR
jgi:alpha-ketoglutarate-dependent taurine dioxygenase